MLVDWSADGRDVSAGRLESIEAEQVTFRTTQDLGLVEIASEAINTPLPNYGNGLAYCSGLVEIMPEAEAHPSQTT